MNHEEYLRKLKNLKKQARKIRPPFRCITIRECDGGIKVWDVERQNCHEFTPKEAVRIAKWILEHYGEEPEEIYID